MKSFKKGVNFAWMLGLSRILGMMRDILIASTFGSGVLVDIFVLAQRVPNAFRLVFAEETFGKAFIPQYIKIKQEQGEKTANYFSANVFYITFAISIVTVIFLSIFTPELVATVAPGLQKDPLNRIMMVESVRWILPFIIFLATTTFFCAMLQSSGIFFVTALQPIILNLSLFIFIVLYYVFFKGKSEGFVLKGFMLATVLSGFLHLLLSLFWCYKTYKTLFLMPNFRISVKSFFKRTFSFSSNAAFFQVNSWVDTIFASFYPAALSNMQYHDRIIFLPIATIGVATSIVALPKLSALLVTGQKIASLSLQNKAIFIVLSLSIPASFGLYILSDEITRTLFYYGAMDLTDIEIIASLLRISSFALPVVILYRVLVTFLIARGFMLITNISAVTSMCCNILLNFLFVRYFGMEVRGIILSTVISHYVVLVMLFVYSFYRKIPLASRYVLKKFVGIVGSSILMILFIIPAKLYLINLSANKLIYAIITFSIMGAALVVYPYLLILTKTYSRKQFKMIINKLF